MRIDNLEIAFNYITREGEPVTIQAFLNPYSEWHQWGAHREELSKNVQFIEALMETAKRFT